MMTLTGLFYSVDRFYLSMLYSDANTSVACSECGLTLSEVCDKGLKYWALMLGD